MGKDLTQDHQRTHILVYMEARATARANWILIQTISYGLSICQDCTALHLVFVLDDCAVLCCKLA